MKAQDYKDIKTSNLDTIKVMANNEVWWQKNTVPGPSSLIGGNLQAGFYGEVPTSDFITGDELARRIGLTAGTSQFSSEPWLKFSYLGKTEFIAKKPFRHSVSWDNINALNAVFGNRTIKIGDNDYKVRLMKGKTEGKQNDHSSYSGSILHNSEWNRLMLPIHVNAPDKWMYPKNVEATIENWGIGYTDRDLLTSNINGSGSNALCQEYASSMYDVLRRGYRGISCTDYTSIGNDSSYSGWRPVLELVD